MQSDDFEDTEPPTKRTDHVAMRILRDYLAKRDGEQHDGGLVIDREFIVVEAA